MHLTDLAETLAAIPPADLAALKAFVAGCEGTLYVCGNGGSYAVALHWACDLQKAAGRRVVALGANGSLSTAWANDDGYPEVFASELALLARKGDRLLCLSCSGTSDNVLRVLRSGRDCGLTVALVCGSGLQWPTPLLRVPATDYGVIEDVFAALGHWLTKELA